MTRVCEYFVSGSLFDHRAAAHEYDAIGNLIGETQLVG